MRKTGPQHLLLIVLWLSACASTPMDTTVPVANLYCDNFLIYDMCAQDIDGDGIVEWVYFEDTNEIFLVREGVEEPLPTELAEHRCMQKMDDAIVHNTSQLFYISDDTNYIERADIKSALMFSYVGYMPRVMRCNQGRQAVIAEPAGDEFDF